MKLSEAQRRTLDLMANGWDLHTTSGPNGSAFLSRLGSGMRPSNFSTLHALWKRGLIKRTKQNVGGSRYETTEAGRAALSEDE